MEYETVHGLRREHSYNAAVSYVQRDPDKITYPKRPALHLQASNIYGQVEAGMRNYGQDAQRDQARYRASDEPAPYVPPKPPQFNPRDVQEPQRDGPDVNMGAGRGDDQITGGPSPPPAPGGGYAQVGLPHAAAQGLRAEGIQPAPSPEPVPQLINYQPPPPPPQRLVVWQRHTREDSRDHLCRRDTGTPRMQIHRSPHHRLQPPEWQ